MYIKLVINKFDPTHTRIRVFDGSDREHLGCCGELCMTLEGAEELLLALRVFCKVDEFSVEEL